MNKFKKRYSFSLIASSILLFGCNSENNNSSTVSPDQFETPALAIDGFQTVIPNIESFIDLSPYIRGTNVSINAVKTETENPLCGEPTVSGNGIKVKISEGLYCQFSYSVKQSGIASSRAVLNVLASEALEPTLPPISQALTVGATAAMFNLSTLLGSDWKASYSLNADSVEIQGMTDNLGEITNIDSNIITFRPPSLTGWNRIIYTLNDADSPTEPVMGVIYVTVSDKENHAPKPQVAAMLKYDFNEYNTTEPVIIGETKTLDLSSLNQLNIVDEDSDEWQLVDITSFSAQVEASDGDSVTNKSFEFTAPTVGDHIVSYIIADYRGGYTSGLIKVTAGAKGGAADWFDITSGSNVYTAPMTYVVALDHGYHVSALWDEAVNNTVAGYNQKSAASFCNSFGVLPSIADMQNLLHAPKAELQKWPKAQTYLASDGSVYKGFDLTSGSITTYDNTTPYYVTCLLQKSMTLDMLKYTVVADGEIYDLAKVTMPASSDAFTFSKVDGSLEDHDVNLLKGTQDDRSTTLTTLSTKSGTYRFKVENSTDTAETITSSTVHYIGDAKTGTFNQVTGLVITQDNSQNDGVSANKLVATLTDAYDNLVTGATLTVTLDEASSTMTSDDTQITISPASGKTDSNGQVQISVTATTKGQAAIQVQYDGNVVSGQQTKTAVVTFKEHRYETYPCNGNEGDYDCVPIRESSHIPGLLYAAPPTDEWISNASIDLNTTQTAAYMNSTWSQLVGRVWFRGRRFDREPSCVLYNIKRIEGRTNWEPIANHNSMLDAWSRDNNEADLSNKPLYLEDPSGSGMISDENAQRWPALENGSTQTHYAQFYSSMYAADADGSVLFWSENPVGSRWDRWGTELTRWQDTVLDTCASYAE